MSTLYNLSYMLFNLLILPRLQPHPANSAGISHANLLARCTRIGSYLHAAPFHGRIVTESIAALEQARVGNMHDVSFVVQIIGE